MNRPGETQRAAEGEPSQSAERLQEVFARCQDELLGTLYYMLGNVEDAQDALQESFVKCWRHRAEVAQVQNLRAWVFRVAINAGRDLRGTAWRRRRRPLQATASELTAEDGNPQADAARREQLSLVRQALTQLRPEEQEVFLLRQNGEMTYDEIARSIDLPVGTVKTRMRLALTKLRKTLCGERETGSG
jgi:RNA polymerase sigma-70 factor (ECF subfamily)